MLAIKWLKWEVKNEIVHAYGPKFTEFKNGQFRNDGAANEQYERDVFGRVFKVEKFGANDGWKMVHEHHSPLTA